MIIISFGMQRSGSTLFYELIKLLLEDNGFPQAQLPADLIGHDGADNFVDDISVVRLEKLREHCKNQQICLKTHSPASDEVLHYLSSNNRDFPVVIVNYRDPRAIGLSLLDAGHKARLGLARQPPRLKLALYRLLHRNPYSEAFANLIDHGDALDMVSASIKNAKTWTKLRQNAVFGYEDLMIDFDGQLQVLAKVLGLPAADAAIRNRVEERFTQKHVGEPERFKLLMSDDMQLAYVEQLAESFQDTFGGVLIE